MSPNTADTPKKTTPTSRRHRKKSDFDRLAYYTGKTGHLGSLVIPLLRKRDIPIADVLRQMELAGHGLRRHQFVRAMTARQETFAMTVEQVIHLAEYLGVDPLPLIEAYLLDYHDVSDHDTRNRYPLYPELYTLFRWYKALKEGQDKEDAALPELATLVYLYEVYRHVMGQSEAEQRVFLGTLHAFMENGGNS